jgi:hypothetical protein
MKYLWIVLLLTFLGPLWVLLTKQVDFKSHWSNSNRSSSNLAPNTKEYADAIIQIYAARVYHWRGLFAVHTWIAIKPKNAEHYTTYQVIGWRKFWGLPAFASEVDIPDRYWFGNHPKLLKDIRGVEAEKLIPKIQTAALNYPYKEQYTFWPGPNSNTFTAFVARNVLELKLALPPTAIGKDYLGNAKFFANTPSGTGYQLSLYGILGILLAKQEGLEINIMGLVWGLKLIPPALILPGLGAIP